MSFSKLNLDRDRVAECRLLAEKIIRSIVDMVESHSTVSIERACLRMAGLNDFYKGRSVTDLFIEAIPEKELGFGAFYWLGKALCHQHSSPLSIVLKVAHGSLKLSELPDTSLSDIKIQIEKMMKSVSRNLDKLEMSHPTEASPSTMTALLRIDASQEASFFKRGAPENGQECFYFERVSGQGLLDEIPHEEHGEKQPNLYTLKRTEWIAHYLRENKKCRSLFDVTGLAMPEWTFLACQAGVSHILCDGLYGILSRDLDSLKSIVDYFFALSLCKKMKRSVMTQELKQIDSSSLLFSHSQTLTTHFLHQKMAERTGFPEDRFFLNHPFRGDQATSDTLVCEFASLVMYRDIFYRHRLFYSMKEKQSLSRKGVYWFLGKACEQDMMEISPHERDEFWHLMKISEALPDDIHWHSNAQVVRKARSFLEDSYHLLQKIHHAGFFHALEKGLLSGMSRVRGHGRGHQTCIRKKKEYFNPVFEYLEKDSSSNEMVSGEKKIFRSRTDRKEHADDTEKKNPRKRNYRRRRSPKKTGAPVKQEPKNES